MPSMKETTCSRPFADFRPRSSGAFFLGHPGVEDPMMPMSRPCGFPSPPRRPCARGARFGPARQLRESYRPVDRRFVAK